MRRCVRRVARRPWSEWWWGFLLNNGLFQFPGWHVKDLEVITPTLTREKSIVNGKSTALLGEPRAEVTGQTLDPDAGERGGPRAPQPPRSVSERAPVRGASAGGHPDAVAGRVWRPGADQLESWNFRGPHNGTPCVGQGGAHPTVGSASGACCCSSGPLGRRGSKSFPPASHGLRLGLTSSRLTAEKHPRVLCLHGEALARKTKTRSHGEARVRVHRVAEKVAVVEK